MNMAILDAEQQVLLRIEHQIEIPSCIHALTFKGKLYNFFYQFTSFEFFNF